MEKQWEEFLKAAEEHDKEWHMQFLEEEITELKRRLNEIENIIKKPRRTRKS
jgi:vacuolar-type H+-ATPase subunit D/Vma8